MADIKRAHAFTCDVWQFYKDHSEVKTDDEYWQSVVTDAGELVKKYGGSEQLKKIILDVIEILEEEEKKQWQKSNV